MPGCAAVGCNNRSEKGYIMKCFPRDPKLRKIWQDRVARADWEPSNNSFLCHVHFEPEEWSITQNGRIRLKKNAIPSIFTVTSTRKSAKKRIRLTNVKNGNECENDYMTESLENDTEHSSTGHLEEKDSDSQDVDPSSLLSLVYQQANNSSKKIENKQASCRQYIDITNDLQQENIIISDNTTEMESNTKEDNTEKPANAENKKSISDFIAKNNSTGSQNEDVAIKTEIKRDINQIFDDSYDEIEEKLKQICDGHREENISNTEKLNSISKNRKGALEKSVAHMPFHKSINYKYSSKNEIGDMLADNRDNIEIIFGSESGEDCARVPKYTFYNNSETNEIDKRDQHTTKIDSIANNGEMDETSPEYIEEAFSRENTHVASNMKTAAKRRAREEVMKSIKKSVRNASFQDTNSMSNSDTSDMEVENEIRKALSMSEIVRYNKDDVTSDTTKFTVKVTGDREDVFDIMQDLFEGTKDFTIQERNNTCLQQENNASVTSIITIDDCPIEVNAENKCNDDIFLRSITNVASRGDDQVSSVLSTSKDDECLTTRLLSSNMDEEKDSDINNAIINNATEQPTTNYTNKCEYEKLQQKVKLQQNVIKRLTNQLILLKDLEKELQDKNLALKARTKKIEKRMNELNTSTDGIPSSTVWSYKQAVMRQRLIYDLSNRMSNLEETNKKLMKTITIECQQKRQLESQIKQRDKRIKELNWKLEKASKYLERAEKNTNTYKRKMLNMQTFMRRKKLLDRNTSRFHEIVTDSMKETYSERVVAMAMEIKDICGMNGYKKLLNFGFPLPALSDLQISPSDDISDSSKSSNKIKQAILLKHNTNEKHNTQPMKNNAEIDTKNQAENAILLCGEIVMDNTETVTGTVQDIFEESNDVDDFSTNELKEHFMLQLNAVI